jgi:hypothetical protein
MKIFKNPVNLHRNKLNIFNDIDVAVTRLFLFHLKLFTLIRCQYHKEPYPPNNSIDINTLEDISINDESIAMAIFPSTQKQIYERSKISMGEKLFPIYDIIIIEHKTVYISVGSSCSKVYAYLL